ncbi:MAG: hypothetical protein ACKOEO_18850 [Planctomycetaceae bacterium]
MAKAEIPPKLNVADRVLATLKIPLLAKASVDIEYALFGFGSLVAACVALILFTTNTGDESLIMFAEPFITVSARQLT